MADPAFAEMEAEAEAFMPQVRSRVVRADKSTDAPEEQGSREELNPLLGLHVLSRQPDKQWYNTPSVRISCLGAVNVIRYFGCFPHLFSRR
jgi:hypothetical protein